MVEVEPGVGIESAWDFLEVGVKAGTSVGVEDSIVFDNKTSLNCNPWLSGNSLCSCK